MKDVFLYLPQSLKLAQTCKRMESVWSDPLVQVEWMHHKTERSNGTCLDCIHALPRHLVLPYIIKYEVPFDIRIQLLDDDDPTEWNWSEEELSMILKDPTLDDIKAATNDLSVIEFLIGTLASPGTDKRYRDVLSKYPKELLTQGMNQFILNSLKYSSFYFWDTNCVLNAVDITKWYIPSNDILNAVEQSGHELLLQALRCSGRV